MATPTPATSTTPTVSAAEAAFASGDRDGAEAQLKAVLAQQPPTDKSSSAAGEAILREQELALLRLGQLYRDEGSVDALASVVRDSHAVLAHLAKAKTAKLIRQLIDLFGDVPGDAARAAQIRITEENIEWARGEKRIFLKQSLETKLIALYYDAKNYRAALPLIEQLLKELKKLDDKMILTEVHLLESRVNFAIANLPKAKTALTSARTSANAMYTPPLLQAQLDLQSGVLHAEDKDYSTAYSYFFETLEGFSGQEDPRAGLALKYMLLCKIMLNLPEDVAAIIQGKTALVAESKAATGAKSWGAKGAAVEKATERDVEAMSAVAKAHEQRSLEAFETALKDYQSELSNDPIIRNHLAELYDTLLEQNLLRVIEPYSRVELGYVAQRVRQPEREVEQKLSQMILDKTFHGILDQGNGCLVVFDEPPQDKTYEAALQTLKHVGDVVDSLAKKANKLG